MPWSAAATDDVCERRNHIEPLVWSFVDLSLTTLNSMIAIEYWPQCREDAPRELDIQRSVQDSRRIELLRLLVTT
jgi:hypothetical protein